MITALLITIMGAIPEPRYNVDNINLTQAEFSWLIDHRIAYEQKAQQQARVIGNRIAEAEADIKEMEAERDAMQQQADRDAIDAQILKIRDGVIERNKNALRKIYATARPSAADARRLTISSVFGDGAILTDADANSNGTLSRGETGWPVFVFNALDANSDGALTTAEIQAYLSSL